jgi:hypothetical protein
LLGWHKCLLYPQACWPPRTRTAVTPQAVTPEESNRGHRIAATRLGGSPDRVLLEGIHETSGTHWKSSTGLKPALVDRPSHEIDASGLTGFPPSASLLLSAETNITASDKSH